MNLADALVTECPAPPLSTVLECVMQQSVPRVWAQARQQLKPGAHAAVIAVEGEGDVIGLSLRVAGFEIRDVLAWVSDGGVVPVVLARAPMGGTVADTVRHHGTGALNIDACRIPVQGGPRPLRVGDYKPTDNSVYEGRMDGSLRGGSSAVAGGTVTGRWPTNVILDAASAQRMDLQAGTRTSGKPGVMRKGVNEGATYGAESRKPGTPMVGYGDTGGASRFFVRADDLKELRQWLTKLICPQGGTVLDPFAEGNLNATLRA